MSGRLFAAASMSVSMSLSMSMFLFLFLLASLRAPRARALGSFQSGPATGSFYAGGLDSTDEHVFVTGITYANAKAGASGEEELPTSESSCFVTVFESDRIDSHPQTIASVVGDGSVTESCHALNLLHDPMLPSGGEFRPFVVVGTSDPGGIYGSTGKTPSGFLMALNPKVDQEVVIRAGLSLDDAARTASAASGSPPATVSYPVSVLYEYDEAAQSVTEVPDVERREGVAYVLSLTSTDLTLNPSHDHMVEAYHHQPNWLRRRKYGTDYSMTLQRFLARPKGRRGTKLEADWTVSYPVEGFAPQLDLAGMVLSSGGKRLVVAGSTDGSGEVYGRVQAGTIDTDGFLAVVEATTGTPVGGTAEGITSNLRVGTSKDDTILAICDDPTDDNFFFVVGSTGPHDSLWQEELGAMGGRIDGHDAVLQPAKGSTFAFVQRRNSKTLEMDWGKIWGARKPADQPADQPATVSATACKALPDGTLYVAGIVEDGAHLKRDRGDGSNHQRYGDDVFAIRFVGSNGAVGWIAQFGSLDGSEGLAPGGAIAVDKNQNLVLFGETTGSLYRKGEKRGDKTGTSDIFLTTLTKSTGSHDLVIGEESFLDATTAGNIYGPKGIFPSLSEEEKAIFGFNEGKWNEDQIYGDKNWFDQEGIGVQQGPNPGALFAGGMIYNPQDKAVYMTAVAFPGDGGEPNCLLTKLPVGGGGAAVKDFSRATFRSIGSSDEALEVCSSVAMHNNDVVVVGSAEQGSTLASPDSPMGGYAMALDNKELGTIDSALLSSRTRYPTNVLSDGENLYILALTPTDDEFSREYKEVLEVSKTNKLYSPDWMNMQKYGTSLNMAITKLSLRQELVDGVPIAGTTFARAWSKNFPIRADEKGLLPRVALAGAVIKKDRGFLAVAGSTRGTGYAYGPKEGDDEDGFLALISLQTGDLATSEIRNTIREGTAEYDDVLGICDDPADDGSLYLVGTTKGSMASSTQGSITIPAGSLQAYIRKVSTKNLATSSWTVQLGAVRKDSDLGEDNADDDGVFTIPTTAKAIDCVVSGDNFYVAGIVDDNARMVKDDLPRLTRGGDDVWVAQIHAQTGKLGWLRQVGSPGNDHLAPHGALALTEEGNILVYGDTNSRFHRDRPEDDDKLTETFLMEFGPNGRHKSHVRHYKQPRTDPPAAEENPVPIDIVNAGKFDGKGLSMGGIIGITVSLLIVLSGLAYYFLHAGLVVRRSAILRNQVEDMVEDLDGVVSTDKSGTYSDAWSALSESEVPSEYDDDAGNTDLNQTGYESKEIV